MREIPKVMYDLDPFKTTLKREQETNKVYVCLRQEVHNTNALPHDFHPSSHYEAFVSSDASDDLEAASVEQSRAVSTVRRARALTIQTRCISP